MNTKEKKEFISSVIEQLSDEQTDYLHNLMQLQNKGYKERIEFFMPNTDYNKIDSAYPVGYLREIEKIYPDAKNGWHLYDYNKQKFGELVNINNHVATELLSFFSHLY